jgi:RimJ/RimL family protein N-acetyltransferase
MGFQRHAPGEGEEISYLLSEAEPARRVGFDPGFIEAELTYALGRAYWHQGYATEMGRRIIAYGFETLGIGRIIQGVRAANLNSVSLMRRLGFRIEKGLDPGQVVGVLGAQERASLLAGCGG